jgi:aminopeptidase N
MRDPHSAPTVRREDYRVPEFLVDRIDLFVDIHDAFTRITSELHLRRNPASTLRTAPLRLNGEGIALRGLQLDGVELEADRYVLGEQWLEIAVVPDQCVLRTVGDIDPVRNTALEGLYVSHGMYCTQCEAEGFRRITWYPDRPDVLARFSTTIEADRAQFPLLLSNGNRVAHEQLPSGRHRATWEDPFPKPCYLFALVAGDLACREDTFVTRSGRPVTLQVFVEPHDLDKTAHAMDSLKRSMKWDEDVFGCEYDLDIYMVVAVSHFNMGAMENKGLNVFNTSCVLANQRTQTDKAFQRVEAVIAHEYFHNWSGNRVTCRDWFQLSLKEGFTVFRDSEFSKDMHSRAVKRIEEVNFLRTVQFPEDAGPLAHAVRPESYVEINNFYTVTIYEKGAEVVRMLQTLLGDAVFKRGCRLYFERHDGQAATCEDFVCAMEDASGVNLAQFRRWYSQAGTPAVDVEVEQSLARGEYVLRFRQTCPPTPGQSDKQPFVIPLLFGLLDAATGDALPLTCDDSRVVDRGNSALFVLDTAEAEIRLRGISVPALPSLMRGFSAPVKLQFSVADEQLAFLARHDSDAFNRWSAGQELALRCLLREVASLQAGRPAELPALLREHVAHVLASADADPALAAEMLLLPAESYIADQMSVADPGAVHEARQSIRRALAQALRQALLDACERHRPAARWQAEPSQIASRALRNAALDLLAELSDSSVDTLLNQQFDQADNMTDQFAALRAVVHGGHASADSLLAQFYRQWQKEALVIDQWFSVQVTSPALDALARARELLAHRQFEMTNPNRVRALLGAFASNSAQFHRADGEGYRFLAEQIAELDRVNPQIAARLAGQFSRWRRCDSARQAHAAAALESMLAREGLSPNLYEVVQKTRYD